MLVTVRIHQSHHKMLVGMLVSGGIGLKLSGIGIKLGGILVIAHVGDGMIGILVHLSVNVMLDMALLHKLHVLQKILVELQDILGNLGVMHNVSINLM